MKEFDYYIFIDYSDKLIGHMIIENKNLKHLLPKILKFKHYRDAENRKLYLRNIRKSIKRDKILSYLLNFKC